MPAVQEVDLTPVVNRVKRAQGQLGGVLRMIEEGRDVEAVVHQLKAVSRAVDRAGFALVAAELRQSVVDGTDVGEPELAKLEKFFLSLA
ncbi:metal-sensitive transcriptional regulator [Nocardioides marmotae]|uniref:metal-sensitive transcriptional regulator n=1 Tax=Nocardioides marmotae TaxID=2663857 RepID=UPI003744AD07